jgi:hypothetical protein
LNAAATDCGIVAASKFAPDALGGPTGTIQTAGGSRIAVTRHAIGISCEKCAKEQK